MSWILWVLAVVGAVAILIVIGMVIDEQIGKAQKRAVERALKAYGERFGATETPDAMSPYGFGPWTKGAARAASESDVKALWRRLKQLEQQQTKTTKKSNNKETNRV